jgi:hypothetical protein
MRAHDEAPDEDALPAALGDAARALRAEVPVRPAWRDAVLAELAAEPAPRRPHRTRLVLSPAAGIAAALACMAGGAALARLALPAPPAAVAAATPAPGDSVRFVLVAPGAARVALVGDFNGWDPDASPMRAGGDGRTWRLELPLAPGRHAYAFVVDGDVIPDPVAPRAADDDFGIASSVVLVAGPST